MLLSIQQLILELHGTVRVTLSSEQAFPTPGHIYCLVHNLLHFMIIIATSQGKALIFFTIKVFDWLSSVCDKAMTDFQH